MILKILKWIVITIVVGLFLLWLGTGGFSAIIANAKKFSNPIQSVPDVGSLVAKGLQWNFVLPWQPDLTQLGAHLSPDTTDSSTSLDSAAIQEEVSSIKNQVDSLESYINHKN